MSISRIAHSFWAAHLFSTVRGDLAMLSLGAKPRVVPPSRSQVIVNAAKQRPQSRIGKKPVQVPKDVTITLKENYLTVKGPKGELARQFHPLVTVEQDGALIKVARNEDTKEASAMHGMTRALCQNMVTGVASGFKRELELRGVGYRAATSGNQITLNLGYSHPVVMDLPDGITAQVEKSTLVTVESCDNEILGNFAAVIRSKRPPEPYKGKGIRYLNEEVIMKAGKSGKA